MKISYIYVLAFFVFLNIRENRNMAIFVQFVTNVLGKNRF